MSDCQMLATLVARARLRTLVQAFLETLESERDEGQPSDFARMRALLFRIGLEIEVAPGPVRAEAVAGAGPAHAGAAADAACRCSRIDGVLARDHLHDLEQALTALEVLGESHRLEFRTQALLFVEWQLARLDRLGPAWRLEAAGPACPAYPGRWPSPREPGVQSVGVSRTAPAGGGLDILRDQRLLRDSLARARSACDRGRLALRRAETAG